jgi:uncharacterized membrane protein YqjE
MELMLAGLAIYFFAFAIVKVLELFKIIKDRPARLGFQGVMILGLRITGVVFMVNALIRWV